MRISAFAVASPTTIEPGSATPWSRAATFVVSPIDTAWGEAAADEADRGLAGVDPDADVEVRDLPGPRPPGVLLYLGDDRERGPRRALGVVLVRPAGRRRRRRSRRPCTPGRLPPNCSTARLMRLTHSPITSLTSSGPRRSPSVVEPTMSAKSAVTAGARPRPGAGIAGRRARLGRDARLDGQASSAAAERREHGLRLADRPRPRRTRRRRWTRSPALSARGPSIALAVDPGAVERAEILDLEPAARRHGSPRGVARSSGSSMVTSASTRPTTSSVSTAIRCPASGPSFITSEGTWRV